MVEAGWHYSYGYYVLIDHGNGFKTRYAHCSKLNVKVGQRVAQGEYIADVGNTGNSYGAHLHFEIIKTASWSTPELRQPITPLSAPPGNRRRFFAVYPGRKKSNWGPCHFRAQGVEWR